LGYQHGLMPRQRTATVRAPSSSPCGLCGSTDVVLVESHAVRRGLDRLNPRWDAHARVYDMCRACGAKRRD
jgi:hypothetical protein